MRLRLALFVVVFLLLFGCVSYTPQGESPKNETNATTSILLCSDIKDIEEGDRCYYNDAISKNNLTACSFIFSTTTRDNCNMRFAVSLVDPSLCVRIVGKEARDDCYHTLAPMAGVATCNKIENETMRQECRLELGDDTVLCESMEDEYAFYLCMAKSKNNHSLCAQIKNSSLVDDCYLSFAKSRNNYSLCSLPSIPSLRDECFQYFANLNSDSSLCNRISFNYTKYLCLTKLTGNYTLCNELSDYLQRDSCIEVFANEHMNHSICQNISTNLYKDHCYMNIAAKSRNPDICSYIVCYECIEDKDNCYHGVANVTLNVSICGRMQDSFNKDLCYLDVAKAARNPSLCSSIENTYKRNTCYSSIIYNENYDISTCLGIVHLNWKDECYNKFAIRTKNATACERITDQFVKSSCVKDSS